MSEPTTSVGRSEILQAIGDYLGIRRLQHVWSREETARVTRIMRSGESQFFSPPPLGDGEQPYSWRFLRPRLQIVISAPYATGTIEATSGSVALTSGTWPAWAADGELVVDGERYSVASRTSNSVIVLDDTTVTISAGTEYSLERWQYTMPDDFGGFIDPFLTFKIGSNKYWEVPHVSVSELMKNRSRNILTDVPVVAVVFVNSTTASAGQRQEMLIHPIPTAAGVLEGQYWAIQNSTTDSLPYAVGTLFGNCLLASCLAAAEIERDKKPGPMKMLFMERLAAAIAHDKRTGPRYLGYNGDRSVDDDDPNSWRGGTATYNGVSFSDF